jgi:hypothetical protein
VAKSLHGLRFFAGRLRRQGRNAALRIIFGFTLSGSCSHLDNGSVALVVACLNTDVGV